MRSIRQEVLSVAAVLAVPAALMAIFPYGAVGFKAIPGRMASKPSAAFVRLTAEEEAEALKAAKTSWQADSASDRGMRAYLPLGELPEDGPSGPILGGGVWTGLRSASAPVEYGAPTWSPSSAANKPGKIEIGEENRPAPAFSREELLKMDE